MPIRRSFSVKKSSLGRAAVFTALLACLCFGHATPGWSKAGLLAPGVDLRFQCDGNPRGPWRFVVEWMDQTTVRFSTTDHNGRRGWMERPIWATGATLFYRHDPGDGKGPRYWVFDEDLFHGYASLQPGQTLSGPVRVDLPSTGESWQALYRVSAGDEEVMQIDGIGPAKILPVTVEKQLVGTAVTYVITSWVATELGIVIRWVNRGREGTEDCRIVEVRR